MNVKNVEALAALIRAVDGNHSFGAGGLAEALASRGVLAPSALTDGQCADLTYEWDDCYYFGDGGDERGAAQIRSGLEAFAAGRRRP